MLIAQETATISGSVQFEEQVAMTFDPSAIAQQIKNLIRMYSNPRLAALREYTSNARDSHKEAGYKGPVEVTLPTALHPFLTIKDYGLGLSREEVKGFGQFGRSTKAGSNEYIGGFGLGSKSGLAVAMQFTVIARKDGVQNTVIVGRDEHNMPSLGFMPETPTTEANGVTIQIPSNTGHGDWVDIASGNMFVGWEPGSIVVNGKAPARSVYSDEFTALEGGWLINNRPQNGAYWQGHDVQAVIHGVHYVLPADKFRGRNITRVLNGSILSIENGSVDILPSRDDLEWTDRTIDAVNVAAETLVRSIVGEYQRKITTVKSFREAKQIEGQMKQVDLPTQGLMWNGILLDWSRGFDLPLTVGTAKTSQTAKSGYQTERIGKTTTGLQDVHNQHSVLILGCSGETKVGYYKREMKYVDESGETTPFVIAEAEAAGVDVKDVVLYFTTEADTTKFHPGFVAAFTKQVTVPQYAAQAVAQRKVWASQRTLNKGAAAPKPAVVDRSLRLVYELRTYESSFVTTERNESVLIAAPEPFVLLHSDDALANEVLEGHVSGQYSQKIKNLMMLMSEKSQRGSGTAFVLLPRNQKAANLNATNWISLTDWLKTTLSQVVVRTPMQRAAEAYSAKRGYYRRVPQIKQAFVDNIVDPQMREFMTAYANPIKDGVVGATSTSYPEFAVTQPDPAAFDVDALYPLLPMLGDNVQRGSEQDVIDYINAWDAQR